MMGVKCFNFFAKIINEAEHFYYLSSIYDKHKAKGLGETCGNISTFPLALLFIYLVLLNFRCLTLNSLSQFPSSGYFSKGDLDKLNGTPSKSI